MPQTTQWEQIRKIQEQMSQSLSAKIEQGHPIYVADVVPWLFDILMCTKKNTSFQDR